MNIIILGIISLVCFIILSILSKNKIIWWVSFSVVLLINAYNIYENYVLEEKIMGFENRIETSNIQVNIDITVNKDTQGDFDGRIGSVVHTSELITKSEKKLIYKSESGSTKMIRRKRKYSYAYRANLPPEDNIYRNSPEELINAKEIAIPLYPFVKQIRKDIGNTTECTLARLKVTYIVNNKIINTSINEPHVIIDFNNNNFAYIDL